MDALRISPKYSTTDWYALDVTTPTDWARATVILRDRLEGRFLQFASKCLASSQHSGFVVLAIDSLLVETIQQFKDGVTNGQRQSRKLFTRFLEGQRFQPEFDAPARKAFYEDIRCGLLHQAEAKNLWLIRRKQPQLLRRIAGDQGYIVDVQKFHAAVKASLDDYLSLLLESSSAWLRSNLWKKMDQICDVRRARGALYETDATSA